MKEIKNSMNIEFSFGIVLNDSKEENTKVFYPMDGSEAKGFLGGF